MRLAAGFTPKKLEVVAKVYRRTPTAEEFVEFLELKGVPKCRLVLEGVNHENKKYLTAADFKWIDNWRPTAWLTAEPDPEAAKAVKRRLVEVYKHIFRAYQIMDRGGQNLG